VLSETPALSGLSQVVERASRYFRIKPVTRDGLKVDGERVTIEWQVDMLPTRYESLTLPLSAKE
jgi:hypothetical protein